MANGRFVKDKTWCFYALNYSKLRRNMMQGQWSVENLLDSEEKPCIDSLKEKLKHNYTKFILKLQYFAHCVPGSDSYWRNKRAELIYWIGHHVEQGNGGMGIHLC
jgi:hypothetical protein